MPTDFLNPNSLIGMVHVGALPGTPRAMSGVSEIIDVAVGEAMILKEVGFDAVLIENMHDRPYLKSAVGAEITAAMAVVSREVKRATELPCGVQILAGANREALAVAVAAGLEFVRSEGFVFAHVADEGIIEGCAGDLLRYRKQIGAEHVAVFADIKKKHSSHAITADVPISETAKAAEFFLADGIVVTGSHTGAEAEIGDVKAAKGATSLPVVLGSGITPDNIGEYLAVADGVIVGSSLKTGGNWQGVVDRDRAQHLVSAAHH